MIKIYLNGVQNCSIHKLEKIGILMVQKIGKENLYPNIELFDVLLK
jgi:hypothetical protein